MLKLVSGTLYTFIGDRCVDIFISVVHGSSFFSISIEVASANFILKISLSHKVLNVLIQSMKSDFRNISKL